MTEDKLYERLLAGYEATSKKLDSIIEVTTQIRVSMAKIETAAELNKVATEKSIEELDEKIDNLVKSNVERDKQTTAKIDELSREIQKQKSWSIGDFAINKKAIAAFVIAVVMSFQAFFGVQTPEQKQETGKALAPIVQTLLKDDSKNLDGGVSDK